MVDIALIKQRKTIYGSNFECIAKEWEKYLKTKLGTLSSFKLTCRDVAMLMVLMKECRIDAISSKLEDCPNEDVAKKLKAALEDSLKDRDNYEWIAENYEKYKRL